MPGPLPLPTLSAFALIFWLLLLPPPQPQASWSCTVQAARAPPCHHDPCGKLLKVTEQVRPGPGSQTEPPSSSSSTEPKLCSLQGRRGEPPLRTLGTADATGASSSSSCSSSSSFWVSVQCLLCHEALVPWLGGEFWGGEGSSSRRGRLRTNRAL